MNLDTEISMHTLWQDLLNVLRRRKALVLFVATLMAIFVYVGLSFMGDKYEAKASLLVKLGRENAQLPVTVEKGSVFSDGVKKEEINSYIALMTSRPMLEITVDKIGLDRFEHKAEVPKSLLKRIKFYAKQFAKWGKSQLNNLIIRIGLRPKLEDKELILILLEKSLAVERVKDTNVIHLSLKLADPILASDILQTLIDSYLEKHASVVQQTTTVLETFEEQAKEYNRNFINLQDKALNLKKELNIGSLEDQKRHLVQQLSDLDNELRSSERLQLQYKKSLSSIENQLNEADEQIVSSITYKTSISVTKLRERLAELNMERAKIAAKLKPGAAPLQILDDEIASLNKQLLEQKRTQEGDRILTRNPIISVLESRMEDIKLQLASTTTTADTIKKQKQEIELHLQDLNGAEIKLERIELESEVVKKRYLNHAMRLEEARAQELLNERQVANVTVLSPPAFSWKPVAPRRLLIMLGGIIGGFAIGLGLALFFEWQNDTIHDGQELSKLTQSVYLGSVNMK